MPRETRASVLLLFLAAALALAPVHGDQGAPEAVRPAASFSPPYNLSSSAGANSTSAHVVRAADGTLHAVWQEGDRPAYARGAGPTWQPWEWIVPPGEPGYSGPALAVDGSGNVHVALVQGDAPHLLVYTSRPFTGTWTVPIPLSLPAYSSTCPAIAVDGTGGVWVAWQTELADTNAEIYARYRPAGGEWGPLLRVTENAAQDQRPSLAVGSGDIAHLAWRSSAAGVYDILYSRFAGGIWAPAVNLSETGFYSVDPDVAADGAGNVYVVWADEMGALDHFQILFRRWDGSAWLPWTYLSLPSATRALDPALAADGAGNLYAVWTDYRDDLWHPEVYFSHSTDHGATWLGDENVTQNAASSYHPDVAAQPGGYAHIVWEDVSPGQLDILYSRAYAAGLEKCCLPVVQK